MSHPPRPPRPAVQEPSARSVLYRSGWPLVILALLEFVWLGWFLLEPLPNAPSPQGAITRGLLLLDAIPGVVPGVTFDHSLLGTALKDLSHVGNLPQRLPIVAAAALIMMAAIGVGDWILRSSRLETGCTLATRLAIDYILGTVVLGVSTMLIGLFVMPNAWVTRLILAAVAGAGVYGARPFQSARPSLGVDWRTAGAVAIVAPFLVMMLLGSMLPAVDFDVLEYHLQGPKEYYQNGLISFLPHNVYTSMPFNVEMLHLLGMLVTADWWWGGLVGQFLVALFAPCAAVLIASTACRMGSRRAGILAAIVYLTTPWIYRLGVIAYVEGPLCGFQAALLWGVVRGWNAQETTRVRFWSFLGVLAGGAMACKYTAILPAVLPFGILSLVDAWRNRSVRPILCYVLGWSVVMVPWLAKNVMETGNPVYPLAYKVFGGRDWTDAREDQWNRAHGPRPIQWAHLQHSLVEVAGRSDWQSPLYMAFVPLAFLATQTRRRAALLGLYLVWMFGSWWLFTHRLDRFWLPMLPAAAVLAGLGADWSRSTAWGAVRALVLMIAVTTNLAYSSTALAGLNEWTGDLEFLRTDIPRRLNAPLAAIDANLPPDAKVLLVGQAAVFHLNRPILYNTVFNPEILESIAADRTPQEFRDALRAQGVDHVYVDWKEIQRHRHPAGYGFTDFVTPERFADWIAAGILSGPRRVGFDQDLYEVR